MKSYKIEEVVFTKSVEIRTLNGVIGIFYLNFLTGILVFNLAEIFKNFFELFSGCDLYETKSEL